MPIVFSSGSSVNDGSAANATALLLAVVFALVLVVGWLGRSLNGYRNPHPAPTAHSRRAVRRESLHDVVRGWLLLAVLCPVMFVALYHLIHAGSG
jgi:ABC-type Fe3+ transport system permease subunit